MYHSVYTQWHFFFICIKFTSTDENKRWISLSERYKLDVTISVVWLKCFMICIMLRFNRMTLTCILSGTFTKSLYQSQSTCSGRDTAREPKLTPLLLHWWQWGISQTDLA